ncbi:tripartite motif-containing protein 42-like isoform X2 [Polyodon spathula]|uniref:tripartite motif-containing protein 42-like isoform X2 n=1 Tax=Polyodon spathula TaxID=7913 RepID=UPI001B7EEF2A|nr:tripartite motif-containing protein 42-like isoform X2 [Polyodon spathula]
MDHKLKDPAMKIGKQRSFIEQLNRQSSKKYLTNLYKGVAVHDNPRTQKEEASIKQNANSHKDRAKWALYQELTCPACARLYINPILLPCNHSICDACLKKIRVETKNKTSITLKCPACQLQFESAANEKIPFPENHLLKNIMTRNRQGAELATNSSKKRKTELVEDTVFCQLCEQKAARREVKKCVTCKLIFCAKCLKKLHSNKAFLQHSIVNLDWDTGPQQIKCFFHPHFDLIHYCTQLKIVICEECLKTTHKGQPVITLDVAFQDESKELLRLISSFKKVKEEYENATLSLSRFRASLDKMESGINQKVFHQFLSLHEALQIQENKIRGGVNNEKVKGQLEIDSFLKSASKAMFAMEGTAEYISEALKESNTVAFLQTSRLIGEHFKQAIDTVNRPSKEIYKSSLVDFSIDVNPIKEEILKLQGYTHNVSQDDSIAPNDNWIPDCNSSSSIQVELPHTPSVTSVNSTKYAKPVPSPTYYCPGSQQTVLSPVKPAVFSKSGSWHSLLGRNDDANYKGSLNTSKANYPKSQSFEFTNRKKIAPIQNRPKSIPADYRTFMPVIKKKEFGINSKKHRSTSEEWDSNCLSGSIADLSDSVFSGREEPGKPFIYKHAVDDNSAQIWWGYRNGEEETLLDFSEVQIQQIVSAGHNLAFPQDQAGVFSGVRENFFKVTCLYPKSEYLFRVRAINAFGPGKWSEPYKLVTLGKTKEKASLLDEELLAGFKFSVRRRQRPGIVD